MVTTLFPSILPEDDDETDADTYERREATLEDGTCPWCGESYENVRAHASQAHNEAYDDHRAEG